VTKAVDAARRAFGRIDILVNSTVYIAYGSTLDTSEADWDRAFAINARGAFFLTRAVLPSMLAEGAGRIVHLTGSGARDARLVNALSGATKAALERFVAGVAHEVRGTGVAVGLFDPGPVKTERSFAVRGADFDWRGFRAPEAIGPAAVHFVLQEPEAVNGKLFHIEEYVSAQPAALTPPQIV
jgi:NAD(P)-dependent dehydrogenase (short-subunit alcohol dehydrogenase family)